MKTRQLPSHLPVLLLALCAQFLVALSNDCLVCSENYCTTIRTNDGTPNSPCPSACSVLRDSATQCSCKDKCGSRLSFTQSSAPMTCCSNSSTITCREKIICGGGDLCYYTRLNNLNFYGCLNFCSPDAVTTCCGEQCNTGETTQFSVFTVLVSVLAGRLCL